MFRQVTMAFGSEVLFIVICLNTEDFRMKNNLSYKEWIQYLIATAERLDLMGFSDHIVQVLEKR